MKNVDGPGSGEGAGEVPSPEEHLATEPVGGEQPPAWRGQRQERLGEIARGEKMTPGSGTWYYEGDHTAITHGGEKTDPFFAEGTRLGGPDHVSPLAPEGSAPAPVHEGPTTPASTSAEDVPQPSAAPTDPAAGPMK
ncbi:hypothetical protein G3I76_22195, partial [Streptomyces sp. SID11233]|nr:hypothetical protein [Streptomyces sp. SID11233]